MGIYLNLAPNAFDPEEELQLFLISFNGLTISYKMHTDAFLNLKGYKNYFKLDIIVLYTLRYRLESDSETVSSFVINS